MGSRTWHMALLTGAWVMALVLVGCGGSSSATIPIPSATTGQVRLTTDRATYSISDPIGATIHNTTSTGYYALTGHSACTFLQLQQWSSIAKQWRDVDPCADNEPAQALLIRGGMREPFSLTPGSTSNPNAWQTGTYRLALTYSASSNGRSSPLIAHSPGFTIH